MHLTNYHFYNLKNYLYSKPVKGLSGYGVGYRFSFNGQEKDDEVSGAGNTMSAEFWEYDSRLGRRFNLDPKPSLSISRYVCFSNNPIFYSDQKGDTIKRSADFEKSETMMASYNTWAKTRSGKRFLKDYGIGGKHQNITVLFDVKNLYWARGITEPQAVDKTTGNVRSILGPEDYDRKDLDNPKKYTESLGKNENLKFTMFFDFRKSDPVATDLFSSLRTGLNIVHETQHIRLMTASLLKFKTIEAASQQHGKMVNIDGNDYKERLQYMLEFRHEIVKYNVGIHWVRFIINDFK